MNRFVEMLSMTALFNHRHHWPLILLIIYLAPVLFPLEDLRFLVHDYLDSTFVSYAHIVRFDILFADSEFLIPQSLLGLPRGCLASETYVLTWLNSCFGTVRGFLVNYVLIHGVAYAGMYWLGIELLRMSYLPVFKNKQLASLIALSFALLPFWPPAGLSIAGLPLVVAIVLNTHRIKKMHWLHIGGVALVALYGRFVFAGLFVIPFLSAITIGYALLKKQNLWRPMLLVGTYALCSIITDYRLFVMEFMHDFESHRASFEGDQLNLIGWIGTSAKLFVLGQYHSHSDAMLYAFLIIAGIWFVPRFWRNFLLGTLAMVFGLITIGQIGNWSGSETLLENSLLSQVQLRFYVLTPLLWHVVGAATIFAILNRYRWSFPVLVVMLLAISLNRMGNVYIQDYQGDNFSSNLFYSSIVNPEDKGYSSLNDYFASEFVRNDSVAAALKGEHRIACIGLEPQKLQFDGYHTLGGYEPYYPKDNHKTFLQIQDLELDKNPTHRKRLEQWGNKAYMYSHDVYNGLDSIYDLRYDFEKMSELGCKYVISTIPVSTQLGDKLSLLQCVSSQHPLKELYIYKLH